MSTIPANRTDPSAIQEHRPEFGPMETDLGRPRLLIADDEAVVRATLAAQLQGSFQIVGAEANADAAIETAARERPDAALIDVQMPGGGLHATKGIREVSPRTAIVILSIDEQRESVVEFLIAGAMAYERKGMPPHLLIERLQEAIKAVPGSEG
jgi:DNA-binding NarL/FixJ family response regulator